MTKSLRLEIDSDNLCLIFTDKSDEPKSESKFDIKRDISGLRKKLNKSISAQRPEFEVSEFLGFQITQEGSQWRAQKTVEKETFSTATDSFEHAIDCIILRTEKEKLEQALATIEIPEQLKNCLPHEPKAAESFLKLVENQLEVLVDCDYDPNPEPKPILSVSGNELTLTFNISAKLDRGSIHSCAHKWRRNILDLRERFEEKQSAVGDPADRFRVIDYTAHMKDRSPVMDAVRGMKIPDDLSERLQEDPKAGDDFLAQVEQELTRELGL